MIKVYFGPWKHSPAYPLSGGESTLAVGEFSLLRGYDRDFWTNNPFILDVFKPEQIMVYIDDTWVDLPEAVKRTVPEAEQPVTAKLPNGKQALFVEVIRLVDAAAEARDGGLDVDRVKADIRAALLH